MEWVIGSIVGALTIIIQFYIWIFPRLRKNTIEKKNIKLKLKQALEAAIKNSEKYKDFRLSELKNIKDDPHITKKIRSQINELENLASECLSWLNESYLVIRTEVISLSKDTKYKELNDSLISLFNSNIDGVFVGYNDHFSAPIFNSIYKGNLTFEIVRDSLAERRWDQSRKTGDKIITIKEVVESQYMHNLVEELQFLQERQCFKMLRKIHKSFKEKASLLQEEVSGGTG